jgi:hypothetical protein
MKRKCIRCNHEWNCDYQSTSSCQNKCIQLCLSCYKKDNEDLFREVKVDDMKIIDCFKLEDEKYIMAVLI